MTRLAALILTLLLPGAGAHADALSDAVRRGDDAAVAAEARRLGARALERRLGKKDRVEVMSALLAAPRVDEPWLLLPALVARMGEADRPISAAAARAASRIARDLPPEAEVDEDLLTAGAAGCRTTAERRVLAPDVRVFAMECALALGERLALAPAEAAAATDPAAGLADALLADAEPELRRAALYHASDAAALPLVGDPDPAVAATAAVRACEKGALAGDALARAQVLALDPAVEDGLVVAMVPCLDQPTRAILGKKGSRVVKDRLKR